MDIQSTWTALPPALKWLLGGIGSGALTATGVYIKATFHAATNCLPTIQKNTGEMRDDLKELIVYLKTKAEDGKL